MFYLSGEEFPKGAAELAGSLGQALRELFTLPGDGGRPVRIEGGQYPDVDYFGIDLTGARLNARRPPPRPVGVGQTRPALHAPKFEISGRPVHVQEAGVNLDLTAAAVHFDYDRDPKGRPLLLLTAAREGKVEVEISRDDLEALLLAQASAAAAKQGVTVEKTALDLNALDDRSVAIAVRVTAKKFFARANVEIKGQLTIDEGLNARLSGLSCQGEGVVGGLAGNLIRPYLERFNNTELPLMAFSFGAVRLRDLRIDARESLKVTAAFES